MERADRKVVRGAMSGPLRAFLLPVSTFQGHKYLCQGDRQLSANGAQKMKLRPHGPDGIAKLLIQGLAVSKHSSPLLLPLFSPRWS